MSTGIYLDHVGIAVRDLAAACVDWERLGFTTTPLSLHASPPRPGAAVEPSGSGNHCIMLEEGYIELLGVVGPGRLNSAVAMLERYEGAHILALGSKDAAASREAVAARGFEIAPPVALERDALWGVEGRETRRARFANAYLDAGAFPEALTFVIEHRTADVVWQAHQMVHANGAVSLLEAWLAPRDPEEAAGRYGRLAGGGAERVGAGEWVVRLERGCLRLMDAAALAARTDGWASPGRPGMCGLVVGVRTLGEVTAVLGANGVAALPLGGELLVTGVEARGAALVFREA